jgi:MFS family permease
MKLPERRREADHQLSMTRSLIEGTRYIARTRPIRALLALLGVTGLFGMTYMTLMPIFAAKIHGGGADVMGLMLGAVGLGALAGALFLARRVELRGLGRIIMVTTIGFGFGLVVFSASHLFWLSLVILLGVGFCWMVLIAACNTVLQALAEDEMRGRVMSVFSMMLVGMAPFGSLIGGWLADRIGAPLVVAIGGLFCAVAGALFAWQLPSLREAALPILIARGMIPDPLNPISEVAVMARPGAPR